MARSMTLNPPTTNLLPGTVNFREKTVIPHEFTKLPKHPNPSSQPTPDGRAIKWFAPHKGVMLTGYGDWNGNHGPVAVCGYDLDTLEPVTLHENVMTEAFDRIRIFDGHAYLPWTDPKTYAGNQGGFTTDRSGSWEDVKVGPGDSMVHTFDIAKIGGKIHVCGSRSATVFGAGGIGVVWREDGPGVWVEALRGVNVGDFSRFYSFKPMPDGKVRVQNTAGGVETYETVDGADWYPVTDTSWTSTPYWGANATDPVKPLPEGVILPQPSHSVIGRVVHEGRLWFYSRIDEETYISKENTFT